MAYLTDPIQIQAAINNYSKASILWIDTEVADYQTRNPRLSLIQVLADSQDDTQTSVDILDVLEYPDGVEQWIEKIMINPGIEKVFHNAKYDQKFLGKNRGQNITCTLEMAKKIPFYRLPVSNYQLKTLALRLTNFSEINKQEQKSDWGQRPLTEEQLNYAKLDVIYLRQVHQQLLELSQQCFPDPTIENVSDLIDRYQEIQQQWQLLNSEIEHLKQRIKQGMESQKIQENHQFKLAYSQRKTYTVGLRALAEFVVQHQLNSDAVIPLTLALQKQLGDSLDQLPLEMRQQTIIRLVERSLESQ